MKCTIDGNVARIPYVGTGDSKVLPLAQVLAGVQGLVPMMHKKNPGGSVRQYRRTPLTDCSLPLSPCAGFDSRSDAFKRQGSQLFETSRTCHR